MPRNGDKKVMPENIQGKLTRIGNVIISMHETAQIIIHGELVANFGLPTGSNQECIIKLQENAKLIVEGKFLLSYGSTIQVFKNGLLRLHSGFTNCGTIIGAAHEISIGEDFLGARNIVIYDSDGHTIIKNGREIQRSRPVRIGKHVWIGVASVVLKGVTIGDGAIVGANSTVVQDIPPMCSVGGNPAKIFETNITWRN